MKAYLINLDRSTDRLKAADAQLRAAGIDYERVPAVDGRALGWRGLKGKVVPFRYFLATGTRPLLGSCGCALSHNAAMHRLLDSGEPAALIFEDDVVIDPERFHRALRHVQAALDPAKPQLFLLLDHEGETPPSGEGIQKAGPRCAFAEAYVVNAPAARRLLHLNEPMRASCDAWGIWAERGVEIWKVHPPACRQSGAVSDITGVQHVKRRTQWRWYVALWRVRVSIGQALDRLIYRLFGR